MADTPRTVAALQTLFGDNTTREISEQDLRDFLVTALGVYGGVAANYAGNAVPLVAGTYVPLTDIWTNTMPAGGGVIANVANGVFVAPVTGDYLFNVHISGSAAQNNRIIHAAIFVNAVESYLESNRKYTTGGDVGSQSFGGILALNAAEEVDVRLQTNSNTTMFPEHSQFYGRMVG